MKATPRLVAHRGASSVRPENTMVAFRHAVELGADAIEFDVHVSADGVPVVLHDELLHRTTSGTGVPSERSSAYLRGLDAGGWFDARYAGEQVPLLEEVLALEDVELELELKTPEPAAVVTVAELVVRHDALHRTELTSWNLLALVWLKERWPDARLGLFSRPRQAWMTDAVYERSVLSPLPYGAFEVVHAYAGDITPSLVDRIHASGCAAHANDATDAAEIENAVAAGADRLSVNDVALARSLLARR